MIFLGGIYNERSACAAPRIVGLSGSRVLSSDVVQIRVSVISFLAVIGVVVIVREALRPVPDRMKFMD